MRRLMLAVIVLAGVQACGKESSTPAQQIGPACETVASIAANLGVTMRGPYASATLAEFVSGGQFYLPEGATDCDRRILEQLQDACASEVCNSGYAVGGAQLEFCMLRVEAAFYTAHTSCTACGDGICSDGPRDCAEDCHCGNGACERELSENVVFCSVDCEARCGDGFCTTYEYCEATTPVFDNEGSALKEGETEDVVQEFVPCAIDCCNVRCGDGVCTNGVETAQECEQDCSVGYCGDGLCFGAEDGANCSADCPNFICAGGSCAVGGHCFNCADLCDDPAAICGDGVCRGCEVITCAEDCRESGYTLCPLGTPAEECPPGSCGDGTCDWGAENTRTCPFDCELDYSACGFGGDCDAASVVHNCRTTCTAEAAAELACGDGYCSAEESGSISPTASPPGWYDCPDDCGGGSCNGDFYGCLCGNGQCEPWEETGEHACAADCGGAP